MFFNKLLGAVGAACVGVVLYVPLVKKYRWETHDVPDFNKVYGAGSYVLVTGATDGIGKGFCEAFAKEGLNVVLVSRNQEKLDRVAQEIRDKYKVQTVTHALDLSKATKIDFEMLVQKTEGLDVSILVNNAGIISYKRFEELSCAEMDEIVNLNSISVMYMVKMYLPLLAKREKRSAVINLSSSLAIRPAPYMTMYSATKSFVHFLTESLSEEYKEKIDFLSFQPATVITKSVPGEKESWRTSTVDEAVYGAFLDLGRRRVSHGGLNHEMLAILFKIMPTEIRLKTVGNTIKKIAKERSEFR